MTSSRRRRSAGQVVRSDANTEHYRHLAHSFPRVEPLSTDQICQINDVSLRILETVGMRVFLAAARRIFERAGAIVDEDTMRVRIGREIIAEAMNNVPPQITVKPRNNARAHRIGGNSLAFASVGGPPYVSDARRGRRPGTFRDLEDLVRLTQCFDVVHLNSSNVEPQDIPVPSRHLAFLQPMLVESDKLPFIYCRGDVQMADSFDMLRILHGEDLRDSIRCYTNVNINSPLQIDELMAGGIIGFARAGQLTVITPFTMAGAMAPVSLAGALALQNAEALAGITLAQLAQPGAPVVYGTFTTNVDMKSGAPAFGTPEFAKATFANGQLARFHGLPWRSSSATSSPTADAQAAYESQMSIWSSVLAGANIVFHSAGWLEGGLTASFEKFIIDVEMLQMIAETLQPIKIDTDELALDAITAVGPGGHFFGEQHTLERYANAFYSPLVSTRKNYEQWKEAGSTTNLEVATAVWEKKLSNFVAPPLSNDVAAELRCFLLRRSIELGAPLAPFMS